MLTLSDRHYEIGPVLSALYEPIDKIYLERMPENVEPSAPQNVSITPLLRRLWPAPADNEVTAEEIALAISHIFTDQLSPVQTGALLTCLHFTGWDRRADVLAKCAEAMREAAVPIDLDELRKVIKARGQPEGHYDGGLVRWKPL